MIVEIKAKTMRLKCDNGKCHNSFVRKRTKEQINKDFHFCCFQCSREAMKKGGVLYIKSQNTSLEKYGETHHMKNDKQKQKLIETNLQKYNVEQYFQSEEFSIKNKQTCMSRYGVDNVGKVDYIQDMIKDTCMERYGKTNPMQNKDVQEKAIQTNLERYGYEYPSQSPEIRKKISDSSIGKIMSDEARQKMSDARKLMKGNKHPMFGRPRLDIKGENHPNWKGGVTSLYKSIRLLSAYKEWRNLCFERDKWTCTKCSATNCELHIDHIKPFALIVQENNIQKAIDAVNIDELWDINNGRTLCVQCHRQTNTYGYKTKKLLEELEHGSI